MYSGLTPDGTRVLMVGMHSRMVAIGSHDGRSLGGDRMILDPPYGRCHRGHLLLVSKWPPNKLLL